MTIRTKHDPRVLFGFKLSNKASTSTACLDEEVDPQGGAVAEEAVVEAEAVAVVAAVEAAEAAVAVEAAEAVVVAVAVVAAVAVAVAAKAVQKVALRLSLKSTGTTVISSREARMTH